MLPRPRRPPGRLVLLYLAVAVLAFVLLSARHSPPGQGGGARSVTVLAVPGQGQEKGSVQRQLARAVLRLGLPLLDVYGPGPSLFTPGELLNAASWLVAGFSFTGPPSLLKLQVPALALAWPEGGQSAGAEDIPWSPLPLPAVMPDEGRGEVTPSRPLTPGNRPRVIVYQTHAHESFLPALAASGGSSQGPYTANVELNIVRVGEELARALQEEHGIATVHLRTLFDAAGLTGAYMESEKGVRAAMERYPTARVLIDVHRDSTPREGTVTVVGGRPVARVMFVVGQGNRYLPNPHWARNQAFAREIARTMDTLFPPDPLPPSFAGAPGQRYPNLVRQLADQDGDPWTFGRDGRFNQHLSEQAVLIEIGGPGNTLVEELRTARMVARAVAEVLK